MKKVIGLIAVLIFSACLKIQKKSDVEGITEVQTAISSKPVPPASVIFELNNTMNLTADLMIQADKIILGPYARIYTNQFSLVIQATTMDSAVGASIQNFSEDNLVAPYETVGLNGGLVKIKTREAYGNIQVHMNAQQGGPGKRGWTTVVTNNIYIDRSPSGACQPNSGSNSGQSGSFFFESERAANFFITTSMKVAPGGLIGEVLVNPVATLNYQKDPANNKFPKGKNCHVIPQPGKAGLPGQICIKLTAETLAVCEKF